MFLLPLNCCILKQQGRGVYLLLWHKIEVCNKEICGNICFHVNRKQICTEKLILTEHLVT